MKFQFEEHDRDILESVYKWTVRIYLLLLLSSIYLVHCQGMEGSQSTSYGVLALEYADNS